MQKAVLLAAVLTLAGCARQEAPGSSTVSTDQRAAATQASVPAQRASGEVRVAPSEARMGTPVEVAFKLQDQSGQVISDANVQAVFIMDMGSSSMREPVPMKWNGSEYAGRYSPTMAGEWEVNVEARKNGQLLLSMPSTIHVKK